MESSFDRAQSNTSSAGALGDSTEMIQLSASQKYVSFKVVLVGDQNVGKTHILY